jgi:hypothetical protein
MKRPKQMAILMKKVRASFRTYSVMTRIKVEKRGHEMKASSELFKETCAQR